MAQTRYLTSANQVGVTMKTFTPNCRCGDVRPYFGRKAGVTLKDL
jgi:hypothetical protein